MFSLLPFAVIPLFLFSSPAWAQLEKPWQLDLETGPIFVARNDVQSPSGSGARFSLCRDSLVSEIGISLRGRLSYAAGSRHRLSLFVEPLSAISGGYFGRDTTYSGMTIPGDTPVTAVWRFDSYRLTYRYDFIAREDLEAGIGLTANLRSASTEISWYGGDTIASSTGVLPMVNFRMNWMFNDFLGVLLEGDALPLPKERAEDVALAVQFQLRPNLKLRLGYRLLEDGVDVPELHNSALLHYIALGATISF